MAHGVSGKLLEERLGGNGGMEDARGREEEFPWYRYGGMWKVCFFFLFFFSFGRDGGRGMFWFRDGMECINGDEMMMFDV